MANENAHSGAVLEAILSTLERDVAAAHRRLSRTRVILTIVFVFVFSYMTYLYILLGDLDAKAIAEIATPYVSAKIPELTDQLTETAKESAPEVAARAREYLDRAPQEVSAWAEEYIRQNAQGIVLAIEDRLDEFMAIQIEELQSAEPDAPSLSIDELLERCRVAYRGRLSELIDGAYGEYAGQIGKVNRFFIRLQNDEDLSDTERIQKELIEVWVVLVEKHQIVPSTMELDNIK